MTPGGVETIRTARLTLVRCDAAMVDAVMRDEPLPDLVRHRDWPGDDLRAALPLMRVALAEHPDAAGWGPWLIVRDGMVVGDVGGHGPPKDGVVEVGFSVVPPSRGAGIATEALVAFLARLRTLDGFVRAVARTDEDNRASQRVLERAGFRRSAIEEGLVVFTA